MQKFEEFLDLCCMTAVYMTSQINLCAECAVRSITFERFVFVTYGVFLQKISLPKIFPTNPTNVIGFS